LAAANSVIKEDFIVAATTSSGDLWIRRFHTDPPCGQAEAANAQPPARLRLVCFPHAGGSATFFFPMSAVLPATVEVLAVQYPGRQDRRADRPIEDIAELADQISAVLRPRSDLPLAFFGHSMGAVVAFEVARRLEQESGLVLSALFASGRRAPSVRRDEPPVHVRDDDGVVAELEQLAGTGKALLGDAELLRMILPAIRGDYKAIETYQHAPGPKLSCPITVLVGDADPHTTLDEARRWRELTAGPFDLRVFPGGHFYLSSHQAAVADAVISGLSTRV
jgi:surfactin synthase thioesterase subunit